METKPHAAPQIPLDHFIEAATTGLMRAMQAQGIAPTLNPQPEPPGAVHASQLAVHAQGHWIIGLIYEPQVVPRVAETPSA